MGQAKIMGSLGSGAVRSEKRYKMIRQATSFPGRYTSQFQDIIFALTNTGEMSLI